ncbi:hypothetical protein EJB05_37430, partial [Eragrostis curvula]
RDFGSVALSRALPAVPPLRRRRPTPPPRCSGAWWTSCCRSTAGTCSGPRRPSSQPSTSCSACSSTRGRSSFKGRPSTGQQEVSNLWWHLGKYQII